MKQSVAVVVFALAGMALWAAPTSEIVDGRYVLTVPAGETYALTENDVTAIGANDFVLSGGGILEPGGMLTNYTGTIYVTNGIFRVRELGAFGTADGATYVSDAGTLENYRTSDNSGNLPPAFGLTEHFYVEGNGYGGLGAIHNMTDCPNIAKYLTLTGDALFVLEKNMHIRFAYPFDMNHHKLSVQCNQGWFYIVATTMQKMGDIDLLKGAISYQDGSGIGGDATNRVTICSGGTVSLWKSTPAMNCTLEFLGNGAFYSSNSEQFTLGSTSGRNIWAGPITLGGMIKNDILDSPTSLRGITLAGKISGPGGFYGGQGGWLQLANGQNDFAGGASASGVTTGVGDADVKGGFSVLANGAIPVEGGPLALTNAVLLTLTEGNFPMYTPHTPAVLTYPDLVAHGRVVVSNLPAVKSSSFKSLVKTGAGTLSFFGPARILGDADVQGGIVRFATQMPSTPSGLHWYHHNGGYDLGAANPSGTYWGIDPTGVGYAYKAWPYYHEGENPGQNNSKYKNYFAYKGYINIPGEAGTPVVCNFASSITRFVRVDIGGETVVKMKDNTDDLTGRTVGWSRMYVGPAVTLTAGWQPIFVSMYNAYNNDKGPAANTDLGWTANFGIGIDWLARSVTNHSFYVKLQDPGDGSFLRPELDRSLLDPALCRPTFEGAVKFAPGTVFDANDVLPYTPVTFPSLTGLPTIRNGEVQVTNTTWTVRKVDVDAGVPLTVEDGATLRFAPNTRLVVTDVDELGSTRTERTRPLIRVAATGVLVNPPSYTRPQGSKWRAEWSADGKSLDLVYNDGMIFILR
ncbi:MAG: hypothetical protein KBI41_04580 [Kiritimatiellae bacterium]|jgi:hypothetical protein|nr:hypothetical protein [Kiritimatiellia bacterium]